jgi:hypothetical protein
MKRCFNAALATQRIPQLEAPSEPREAAESAVEQAPKNVWPPKVLRSRYRGLGGGDYWEDDAVTDHVRLRAWLLLQAASRNQTRGRAEPIVVLRHPDLARRIGLEPDSPELVAAERFLERRSYIRRPEEGAIEIGAFVITEAGRTWLGYDRWTRPWWRRILGG